MGTRKPSGLFAHLSAVEKAGKAGHRNLKYRLNALSSPLVSIMATWSSRWRPGTDCPQVYPNSDFVAGGGLTSYGIDQTDRYRPHTAGNPPTKYELAINFKTAKSIGLTIPESFLLCVDEMSK